MGMGFNRDRDVLGQLKTAIKLEPKKSDDISARELIENKINKLLISSSDIPDKRTREAISYWQQKLDKAVANEMAQFKTDNFRKNYKPKKVLASIFLVLAIAPLIAISYNAYSYEENLHSFDKWPNVFFFLMFLLFFIISYLLFWPEYLDKFLKAIKNISIKFN